MCPEKMATKIDMENSGSLLLPETKPEAELETKTKTEIETETMEQEEPSLIMANMEALWKVVPTGVLGTTI